MREQAQSETARSGLGSAILVENLVRRFGAFTAVDGVSLDVRSGEIFGFLGPNGAGKSTTIAMLTTLLRPTEGRAFVGGYDVARHAREVRMVSGVALQDIGMDPIMTARELLRLQGRIFGLSMRDAGRRAEDLVALVGLTDFVDKRVDTYSGGMKRRLDLALALVHGPRILFLDEPTTGLDPAGRRTIWQEIRRLNREEGMTIFLTTQYLEEADELGDRIAIIDRGKIVAQGRPEELKASLGTGTIAFRFGDSAAVDAASRHFRSRNLAPHAEGLELRIYVPEAASRVPEVVTDLDRAGVRVVSLTVTEPSLDDVFLSVTGALYREEPGKE